MPNKMPKEIDQKLLAKYISSYLSSRPAFFSFIRPQEAYLFHQHLHLFKSPILDFGCGDGFFADLVFPRHYIDIGLDIEDSRINQAKTTKVYKKLTTFDGKKIPLRSNTISTIFSNSVLEHIPNLSQNLSEIHRILKPSGTFIASVMADKWEQYLPLGKLFGQTYLNYLRKKQEHYNLYSHKKWQRTFNKHGLEVTKVVGYLSPSIVKYNELFHYLSIPSLLSYKLAGKWILFPNWHKPIHLDQKITCLITKDIYNPTNQSASEFFILKKTNIS